MRVFREAPPNKSLVPPTWMSPADVSAYVSANHDGARLRQVGGMWIRVSARDPRSGVQRAAEIVDRVASRGQVGTTGNLVPLPQVYVRGFKGSYPLRERRRRVEVHALFRENQLYSFEKQVSRVDSAIELLSPLDASSPSTAVAGGWAAIEELLTSTGDENRVNACHRMAALVACSFSRSELTGLSYEVEKVGGAATAALKAYGTNRDRAACVAN